MQNNILRLENNVDYKKIKEKLDSNIAETQKRMKKYPLRIILSICLFGITLFFISLGCSFEKPVSVINFILIIIYILFAIVFFFLFFYSLIDPFFDRRNIKSYTQILKDKDSLSEIDFILHLAYIFDIELYRHLHQIKKLNKLNAERIISIEIIEDNNKINIIYQSDLDPIWKSKTQTITYTSLKTNSGNAIPKIIFDENFINVYI